MKFDVRICGKLLAIVALIGLLAAGVQAQEKSSGKSTTKSSTKGAESKATKETAKTEKKEPRGRLPQYYADIVTEEQRATIYEIQAKHDAEIEALEKKLEAAKALLNDEIEAVLTPAQLKKVQAAKVAAGEKRKDATDDTPTKKTAKTSK